MSECCGQKRDGRYCSECGKELSGTSSLWRLVKRCRHTASVVRSQGLNRKRKREKLLGTEDERIVERTQAIVEKSIETAAMWIQWADELERLITATK